MNEINEIKLPKGVESISVTHHDDKIVIEFIPEEAKFKEGDFVYEDGKRWNAEKLIVEDIPQPKFKIGDKVRIKDGISSKTHRHVSPCFTNTMDKFIGKELTVKENSCIERVEFNEDDHGFHFHEDWLEFYTEELKKGDLAIFWGDNNLNPTIRLYNFKSYNGHSDNFGTIWGNAVKWDGTKEQLEKVLRGETN